MASPWKFLVGLTRRHGRGNESTAIEDTSDAPVAKETQEPAPLQPADGAQDIADPVDAVSTATDDSPDTETVVAGAALPDEPGLRQVDDLDTTTGPGLQTDAVDGSATTKLRKPRASRKKNVPGVIQPTPSTAPVISNDFQDLEDEIRQLRSQLAKKLQLQNAQLRQMLERFDR
ncbi:hypothetical protein [Rhizobium sp. R693]|uniref:hypothetical protein n=1 Tax=Rhizobium sp. R693 TaxID=1764276 RepID=UPI0011327D86|nr:hypothetical protein [Rhizobium sp. R693]